MITPEGLRKRYSLAIAVLVHAILVVLIIGAAMIPRGNGGAGGGGVGLEFQDGDSDVATPAPPLPEPPVETTSTPTEPAVQPALVPHRQASRMAISPGGRPGGDLYLAKVRAHLARFRQELPPGIRSRGTVALRFKLSAGGIVTQARVATSSGDPKLDDEALQLLTRASPLPSRGTDTELIVPIEFLDTQKQGG